MKFCQDHWDRLRDKVTGAGLSALVADSGEDIARKMASEQADGRTIDNYDPLMSAHWAIVNNLMLAAGPDAAAHVLLIDGCPLCVANAAHAEGCTDPDCGRLDYFDDFLDFAVADEVKAWKALGESR